MDSCLKRHISNNRQSDISAATLFRDQTHVTNNEPHSNTSVISPASHSLYRIYDVPKPYVPYNVSVKSPKRAYGTVQGQKTPVSRNMAKRRTATAAIETDFIKSP